MADNERWQLDKVQGFADATNDGSWLVERFPMKPWHRHRRYDGKYQYCDGTPSDCSERAKV